MTNSSPVMSGSGNTYTMMRLSTGSNSAAGYTDNTAGTSAGGYSGSTYYPGWYPNSYPTTTGYTCTKCGTYVLNGYTHYCYPKTTVYPTVIYQPVYIPQPTDLTPLLKKLDDLTEEVKKLRKSLQKNK